MCLFYRHYYCCSCLVVGIFPPVKNNFFCFCFVFNFFFYFSVRFAFSFAYFLFEYNFAEVLFLMCLISFAVYALAMHLFYFSFNSPIYVAKYHAECALEREYKHINAWQSYVFNAKSKSNNFSPIYLYSARIERNNRIYAASAAISAAAVAVYLCHKRKSFTMLY